MAYMNQEKKAAIVAKLKEVIPLDWKWTVSVEHHSTLNLNIASAPIDLIGERAFYKKPYFDPFSGNSVPHPPKPTYLDVNTYHLDKAYEGELLTLFQKIKDAMNLNNHDNSDIMTDYFDVGHYIGIHLGKWNKPFVVK